MNPANDHSLLKDTIELAESWQKRANELITPFEKRYQKQLSRLLSHPADKVTLTRLIDQSFRSKNAKRTARNLHHLFSRYGIPDFFYPVEKILLYLFLAFGRHLPKIVIPVIIDKMRQYSSRMIVPGESDFFHAHLRKRKRQGLKMNINHLGEAVLGEDEAFRRIQDYIHDLKDPDIETVSVKISTIYSQIHSLAFNHAVEILCRRLSLLYQTASEHVFTPKDGNPVSKFVYLDMEEFRDLSITTAAFMRTLDQKEFLTCNAGIVLQAYLPDSFNFMKQLTQWAMKRSERGGSPIRIRIVKGANLAMEQVESSLHNWPLATYDNKQDVDANYKRMVQFGMQPDHIQSVHLGIASHNLFDLAYAWQLARRYDVTPYMNFEMLEGMADHVRRAISEQTGEVLLYAPVAGREEFINAIAYLIRRLDENTGPENFLRYSPDLQPDSCQWRLLKDQFLTACAHTVNVSEQSHRIQDRNSEIFPERLTSFHSGEFTNEPDTDWSLANNRNWAEQIRKKWKKSDKDDPVQIPLVIGEKEIYQNRTTRDCIDPSQLPEQICIATWRLATEEDIDQAVDIAKTDLDGWRKLPLKLRHQILSDVAMTLRKSRADLIGAAAANTAKLLTESDPEVSEAIDFTEYYPLSAREFTKIPTITSSGRGVCVVISPWNFPIAIPCGGIVAALSAGNTVIFKPSSDAVLVGWILCQAFWKAGISRNVLQFLPCSGSQTGNHLTGHPGVDAVILTGGTETAMRMLEHHPGMVLSAETGGKNATIVTACSDRDQAIRHVINSAFGNTGQKCSATSLLILEKEVYEDEHFKAQLIDAAKSVPAGSAWEFESRMGPLIRPPAGALERALTRLEPQETWALKPEMAEDNPHLWTPGIKWDVQPGSYTHMTEFFGPLLGVMRADDLEHAIRLVNMTGYGLTSGLESLDFREQDVWKASIKAGNLYINRGTTGAITLRQPFGGMGKSAIGPAIKTGSPNYVSAFMTFEDTAMPQTHAILKDHPLLQIALRWQQKLNWGQLEKFETDLRKTIRAIKSYLYHAGQEFDREKDYFHLRGQDNLFRYLPLGTIVIRVHGQDTVFDTLARIAAVRIAGSIPILSIPKDLNAGITEFLDTVEGRHFSENMPVRRQSDQQLIATMSIADRFRYAAPDRVPEPVLKAAALAGFYIASAPVLMEGRIELLHYYLNQSVCVDYHRYGNLGERAQ
ncbi:MAG: bifunctional proline dehydrogenase/L-glutamate gamma-semialdehyde dehydrogenase [Desulfobacterales bacterium]|nr:bifunctional proline dehydrogenase/L-glutamate gamma-semialdehyde dehydrogenase [Desulfobacterales bacterium]MDD4391945.1 bifunctional proline dehydrogenase/L-glutamate gamma-semialdehyde dehydrogenase [Desulfobacterales bacterium]